MKWLNVTRKEIEPMEFLVSYKVTKRNDINDIVVENINALVDRKSVV